VGLYSQLISLQVFVANEFQSSRFDCTTAWQELQNRNRPNRNQTSNFAQFLRAKIETGCVFPTKEAVYVGSDKSWTSCQVMGILVKHTTFLPLTAVSHPPPDSTCFLLHSAVYGKSFVDCSRGITSLLITHITPPGLWPNRSSARMPVTCNRRITKYPPLYRYYNTDDFSFRREQLLRTRYRWDKRWY
jgi:hypothetical protein